MLGLYLDRLELFRARLRREPYVLGVVAKTNAASSDPVEIEVAIEPARGIQKGCALQLYGAQLLRPDRHGPEVAVRLVVMESDEGMRRVGSALSELRVTLRSTPLGRSLLSAAGLAAGQTAAAARAALDVVTKALASQGDDAMFQGSAIFGDVSEVQYLESDSCRLTVRMAESPTDLALLDYVQVDDWSLLVRGDQVAVRTVGGTRYGTVARRTKRSLLVNIMDLDRSIASVDYGPDEIVGMLWNPRRSSTR